MTTFASYNYAQRNTTTPELNEWATSEEIARYGTTDLTQGVILGANAGLAPHYTQREFCYSVNNNVIAVGGSGAGKTRSFILPNLLNHLEQNYVLTDTKGEISKFVVEGFKKDGYEVTTLDAINIAASNHFDPLRYVESDEDIVVVAEQLYFSVRNNGKGSAIDPFWDEAATLLFRALIGILRDMERLDGALATGVKNAPRKFLNINTLLELTQLLCITEDDSEAQSPLDYFVNAFSEGGFNEKFFEPLRNSYGVEQYNDFRVAAGKTLKSILISLNSSLTKLRGDEMRELFSGDEMRFDEIDKGKRVIILKMSDCDSSKSFLAQIALRQIIQQAFKIADGMPDGKLSRPVQFVLDEFPNVGRIQDFPRVIATARSRNMSFLLCAQSLTQLASVYPGEAQIILDNCDTFVYMGSGSSVETAEYISRLCGKTRVGTRLLGVEKTERAILDDVITPSDLRLLPRTECIVLISGCKPFKTAKYDGYTHPNAEKFLSLPER